MELLPPEEKIARMLGILATQNVKAKMDQVVLLRAGGFTNAEIGEMLDIPENSVSVFICETKPNKRRARRQMLPISPKLMERLEKKLGVRRRRLYELILDVATSRLVERDTAALILAAEQKIPIQLYSTPEQRAMYACSGQLSQAAQTSNIGPSSQPPSRSGKTTQKRPAKRTDENSVFVVHGRDEALKRFDRTPSSGR